MESTDVINEIRGILPRNSIGKYDLLTIFTHKTVFDKIVKVLSLDFQNKVDYVAAPEAIGWILGTAIAKELGVGFIGVRKGDKLPYAKEEIISTHFTDYSGQELIGTVISGFLRFRVKIRFFPRTTTVFAPRTTNPIRIFRQRRLQEV